MTAQSWGPAPITGADRDEWDASPPTRVTYGDLPEQDMHPDVASRMLTELYKDNPGLFGRLHNRATGAVSPPRKRTPG